MQKLKSLALVVGIFLFIVIAIFSGVQIDRWYTNNVLLNQSQGMVATQLANMGYSVSTTYFDTSSTVTIQVAPARYNARYYWLLQNISTNTQWVNFGPTSTAIVNQVPEILANGGSYDSNQINNYPGIISMASTSNPGRMIFVEAYR